jgi:hypothetical protein
VYKLFALLGCLLMIGCSSTTPQNLRVPVRVPNVRHVSTKGKDPCWSANRLVKKAERFQSEGRILRALSALGESEQRCPKLAMNVTERRLPMLDQLGLHWMVKKRISALDSKAVSPTLHAWIKSYYQRNPNDASPSTKALPADFRSMYANIVLGTMKWSAKDLENIEEMNRTFNSPYSNTAVGFLKESQKKSKEAQLYFDRALLFAELGQQHRARPRERATRLGYGFPDVSWYENLGLIKLAPFSFNEHYEVFLWPGMVEVGKEWLRGIGYSSWDDPCRDLVEEFIERTENPKERKPIPFPTICPTHFAQTRSKEYIRYESYPKFLAVDERKEHYYFIEYWTVFPKPKILYRTPRLPYRNHVRISRDQSFALVEGYSNVYSPYDRRRTLAYFDLKHGKLRWKIEVMNLYRDPRIWYEYSLNLDRISPQGRFGVWGSSGFRAPRLLSWVRDLSYMLSRHGFKTSRPTSPYGCHYVVDLPTKRLLFTNEHGPTYSEPCTFKDAYSFNEHGTKILSVTISSGKAIEFRTWDLLKNRKMGEEKPLTLEPIVDRVFANHGEIGLSIVDGFEQASLWSISLQNLTLRRVVSKVAYSSARKEEERVKERLIGLVWEKKYPGQRLVCASQRYGLFMLWDKRLLLRDKQKPHQWPTISLNYQLSKQSSSLTCQFLAKLNVVVIRVEKSTAAYQLKTGKKLWETGREMGELMFLPESKVLVEVDERVGLRVHHATNLKPLFSINLLPYEKTPTLIFHDEQGYVQGNHGTKLADILVCEIGKIVLPYRVCQERYETKDLVRKALKLDFSYRLPDSKDGIDRISR